MKKNKFSFALLVLLIFSIPLHAQYRTEKVDREFDIQGDKEFFLDLDIDAGEVIVKRGSASHKLSVYMRFTENEFEYDLDYSEKNRSLKLTFDKKGWADGDEFSRCQRQSRGNATEKPGKRSFSLCRHR
jgi:hypothetical protein